MPAKRLMTIREGGAARSGGSQPGVFAAMRGGMYQLEC